MTPQPVSLDEYLSASFEYDCEWADGVLIERSGGEFDHSFLIALAGAQIHNRRAVWGVICLLGARIQTGPTRFRVPDLTVLRAETPRERILTHPPLVVIEIQSPEDVLSGTAAKAMEYLAFGIEHVWVVDPYARVAYRGTANGLEPVRDGELTIPETPIRIILAELLAELDRV
jgi:Uma2 family endonuclease